MLQKLSQDYRDDGTKLHVMKERLLRDRSDVFKVENLPADIAPSTFYPTATELTVSKAFGKPNILKSYTVEASLQQILVFLFKSPWLSARDLDALASVFRHGRFLLNRIAALKYVDFTALQIEPLDWNAPSGALADAITANK